jgi:hypothetical protein
VRAGGYGVGGVLSNSGDSLFGRAHRVFGFPVGIATMVPVLRSASVVAPRKPSISRSWGSQTSSVWRVASSIRCGVPSKRVRRACMGSSLLVVDPSRGRAVRSTSGARVRVRTCEWRGRWLLGGSRARRSAATRGWA